jgi:hypothetical protein
MELAKFELSRTFLEKFCAPHTKSLGILMMKENCKEKIISCLIFVQTAHILTDIC